MPNPLSLRLRTAANPEKRSRDKKNEHHHRITIHRIQLSPKERRIGYSKLGHRSPSTAEHNSRQGSELPTPDASSAAQTDRRTRPGQPRLLHKPQKSQATSYRGQKMCLLLTSRATARHQSLKDTLAQG